MANGSPENGCTPDALPELAVWVKVTGEPASPADVAVVLCGPAVGPSVRVTDVDPVASVVVSASLTPPPPTAAQVTVSPATGLPKPSVTLTTSGSGSAVPAGAVWASPDTNASPLAEAETAVAVKVVWIG